MPAIFAALTFAFLIAGSATVGAQGAPSSEERFSVTFEKVVDNCKTAGLSLTPSVLTITTKGTSVSAKVRNVPTLSGNVGRRGKLSLKGRSPAQNGQGKKQFSLNGRVTSSKMTGVLVIEYFKGETPECTQSWNVSGPPAT